MRATLAHTEGYVDRDGIALHYEVYGDGTGTNTPNSNRHKSPG